MTPQQQRFIEVCLSQVGSPYIWGGKGTHLFHPVEGLTVSPFLGNDYGIPPLHVFDCSGLVTWALWLLTKEDQRAKLNAQLLADRLKALPFNSPGEPHLRYYGASPSSITHVAVAIACVTGHWLVVEASGGDSTTTTVLQARDRGAQVRCHFEKRRDFVLATPLPVA